MSPRCVPVPLPGLTPSLGVGPCTRGGDEAWRPSCSGTARPCAGRSAEGEESQSVWRSASSGVSRRTRKPRLRALLFPQILGPGCSPLGWQAGAACSVRLEDKAVDVPGATALSSSERAPCWHCWLSTAQRLLVRSRGLLPALPGWLGSAHVEQVPRGRGRAVVVVSGPLSATLPQCQGRQAPGGCLLVTWRKHPEDAEAWESPRSSGLGNSASCILLCRPHTCPGCSR